MSKDLFDKWNDIIDAKKEEIDEKYDPDNLFLKEHDNNK